MGNCVVFIGQSALFLRRRAAFDIKSVEVPDSYAR